MTHTSITLPGIARATRSARGDRRIARWGPYKPAKPGNFSPTSPNCLPVRSNHASCVCVCAPPEYATCPLRETVNIARHFDPSSLTPVVTA